MEQIMATRPSASAFTAAPLRNRMRVDLAASPRDVWKLLGDLERFPEYSFGLERVDATLDAGGRCTEYACRFKPMEPGAAAIESQEIIRWWGPEQGYASSGKGKDAFGLTNDLHLLILEPTTAGTIVTVDEYFDTQDLAMMKAHFDRALADICDNLARRFDGKVVERLVEP